LQARLICAAHIAFVLRVVFALTLALGLCGIAHVVAGASEAWLLCRRGLATPGWAVGGSSSLPSLRALARMHGRATPLR
jgi:hypothetical protein